MPDTPSPGSASYRQAGVDIAAAEGLIPRYADLARLATRPEVLADIGPFSGLFNLRGYRDPVLVSSADGVGTKLKLAALLGRYAGLGHDLVNHCVNDILTAGAEPLFFLDYIGGTDLPDDAKLELVRGIAEACRDAGCALLGGETADMPGLYASGDFDLVGFIVGATEREAVIDGSRIQPGDVLLGLPSNGLHTNGYSLARRVFQVGINGSTAEAARLLTPYDELGETLADALLRPHRCYLPDLKPVLPRLKGIAHITGGGIPGNLPRILPAPATGSGRALAARLRRGSWPQPPIFPLIQRLGAVPDEEMAAVYNLGLGVILAVTPEDAPSVRAALPEALPVGEVISATGDARVLYA